MLRVPLPQVYFHLSAALFSVSVGYGAAFVMQKSSRPAGESPIQATDSAPKQVSMSASATEVRTGNGDDTIITSYLAALEREIALTATPPPHDVLEAGVRKAITTTGVHFDLGNGKTIPLVGIARLLIAAQTMRNLRSFTSPSPSTSEDSTSRFGTIWLTDRILAAAGVDAKDILRATTAPAARPEHRPTK